MKAIIFDMDGLMIDTERLYVETEKELAKSLGKEIREETIWSMMGRKPLESLTVFVNDLGLDISPEEALVLRDTAYEKKLLKEVAPMPGLFEILNEYKGKLKLAIATGNHQRFLDIVLERLNLRHYFDVLQPSDEIVNGKPHPEIYLKAIEKLGLFPRECIVLEDSGNGCLAGKTAGCYTIAVPSEYTYKQDFSFVDHIARDLNDARGHINKSFFA